MFLNTVPALLSFVDYLSCSFRHSITLALTLSYSSSPLLSSRDCSGTVVKGFGPLAGCIPSSSDSEASPSSSLCESSLSCRCCFFLDLGFLALLLEAVVFPRPRLGLLLFEG